ncbi:MAG TPA: NUDIX domain-containing protein [Candidatus Paceibacterota bacterium]|nr:NUDIX domain-containing protein [Candidatus Paceibacterota bacterium]
MGHLNEKIDFTVCIYIVFENKVLMHRHKKLGIWLPPGGHVELDEDPIQAAIREAKEETGLDIELVGESRKYNTPYASQDLVRPRFLNKHFFDTSRTHEHVNLAFLARAHSADARHEVEGGEMKWFSADELSDPQYNIVADVQHHARVALEELRT